MINYSFIIPHHNGPDLLNRLLDTIPQRNDIEIIVVDDNSDNDKKPLITRPDVKVLFVDHKESKGAGHARNVGLEIAVGKWILFADSDDCYATDFIIELDKFKDKSVDVVYFNAYIGYSEISPFEVKQPNFFDLIYAEYEESKKTDFDLHKMAMRASYPWNKMLSSKFLKRINARFEEVPIGNDTWFSNYTGAYLSSALVLNQKLYCYYISSNNTTNKKRPLSHYYVTINTTIKVNELKRKRNILQYAFFPGFYVKNVRRDYGILSVLRLYLYSITHDRNALKIIIAKLRSKF